MGAMSPDHPTSLSNRLPRPSSAIKTSGLSDSTGIAQTLRNRHRHRDCLLFHPGGTNLSGDILPFVGIEAGLIASEIGEEIL